MLRKLASIQIIDRLESIPGADRIDLATIMGWKVIVKKGEFNQGDMCIFFEIDSILPDGELWAEFMRPRKFRVKTLKMRNTLSQGLALPLNILGKPNFFQKIWMEFTGQNRWKVGDDVTGNLGVKKYDPTIRGSGFNSGQFLGAFPFFIPKTDEIRLQSCMSLLHELKGNPFYISVKCDGTSGTFYKKDGEFFACSRNRIVKSGDNVYWEMAKKYDLENKLPEDMAIQGEICGPGIQKNRLRLKEKDLFVFDVFDIKARTYCDLSSIQMFCSNNGLKAVPIERIVNTDELNQLDWSLDSWLNLAKGYYAGTKIHREGIVVRPTTMMRSNRLHGNKLSFKVINNDYLLKVEN